MAASTSPSKVRDVLDVSQSEYPDAELEPDIEVAEDMVADELAGAGFSDVRLSRIMTYVAADLVYPRVTGEASGRSVSSVSQGSRDVSFESSSTAGDTDSPFWGHAVRLSDGLLEQKTASFEVY